MASGRVEELADVEDALSGLARIVAADPDLVARLRTAPPSTIAELRTLPGAAGLADAVDAFLAVHGHLGHLTEDLDEPSWSAAPGRLLADLAIRTARDDGAAADRRAERQAAAAALEARIRSELASWPTDLATVERALADARAVGWLTEGHNYWIDRMVRRRMRQFTMPDRRPSRPRRRHRRSRGHLQLDRAEVRDAPWAPVDRRGVVADRKAEHAHWRSVTPPPKLGKRRTTRSRRAVRRRPVRRGRRGDRARHRARRAGIVERPGPGRARPR